MHCLNAPLVLCVSLCAYLFAMMGALATDAGPWSSVDPSPSPPAVASRSLSRTASRVPSGVVGTASISPSPAPTSVAGVTVSLGTGLDLNYRSTASTVTFRVTYTGGMWCVADASRRVYCLLLLWPAGPDVFD